MAHWNGEKTIHWPDRPFPGYPGWTDIDCGCCAGVEWGGDQPRECRRCGGSGSIARHEESGVLAWYPGGPLCGNDLAAPLAGGQEGDDG